MGKGKKKGKKTAPDGATGAEAPKGAAAGPSAVVPPTPAPAQPPAVVKQPAVVMPPVVKPPAVVKQPAVVKPPAVVMPPAERGQGDAGIGGGRGRKGRRSGQVPGGAGRGRGGGAQQGPDAQSPPGFQQPQGQGATGPPPGFKQQGAGGPPQQQSHHAQQPWGPKGPRPQQQGQQGPRGPPQQGPRQQGPQAQQPWGPRGPPQQVVEIKPQSPWKTPPSSGGESPRSSTSSDRDDTMSLQSSPGQSLSPAQASSAESAQSSPGRPESAQSSPESAQSSPGRSESAQSSPKMISMSKGLKDMSIVERTPGKASNSAMQIPRRKTPSTCGTLGQRTEVDTNHLALDLSKLVAVIYHYDVSIDPDRPKRLMRMVMTEFQRNHYPQFCAPFDARKNLYSARPLPFGQSMSGVVKVIDAERDREKEFQVNVKLVNKINTTLLDALMKGTANTSQAQLAVQALDIVLRNAPASRMTTVGKSFFTKPTGQIMDLGDGMECWLGFFQSAIIGWKPFVNIDVAHKGFPKEQNCIDMLYDVCGNYNAQVGLNNYQIDDFLRYIRELKVAYEIPGQPNTKRTYRVNQVAQAASRQKFTMDDNRTITVEQYYSLFKNYKLRYPNMPCLDVGSPNREKPILIPCELCTMVGGQVVIKKMTEKQTSNLIKVAATSTDDRKKKIMDAIRRVDFKSDPCLQEFGLRVNDKFERVPARILNPPQLKYKEERQVTPDRGVWRNGQFCDGKVLKKWTILGMAKWVKEPDLRQFVQMLRKQAGSMGMTIEAPEEPIYNIIQSHEKAKLEDFLLRRKDYQLIFVVVQDQGDSYAKLKQSAELSVGVLTQCLKVRTLGRMNPATCGNILLKVNAKLNGLNHQFGTGFRPPCLNTPCMIVGADVTHPPPDQNNVPSVAAVCASHEPKAFKYNLQFRLQPSRMEIIEDLEAIMKIQLLYFYNVNNGQKPHRIIFYRDGVSEGQFTEVLNKEFLAIRRACHSVEQGYEPKITFLVVQKRHHTRFFPTKREDSDGRNNNVPAGTIVDQIITHPTDLDFYLVSHASIQGVSRPTKYRRLWDDSMMSEDEIEQLTYYLCHMFTRCTRSVSYPAPTYYAHLAAYRARCYLDGCKNIRMDNLKKEQSDRTIKAEIIKDCPMFFV